MVKGIEKFREHFKGDEAHYLLIGGSACDLLFAEQGLSFRATKDLDLVLCVEALDQEFIAKVWDFVRAGEYQVKQKGPDRCLYRFSKPQAEGFPFMLELFSRIPDLVEIKEGTSRDVVEILT